MVSSFDKNKKTSPSHQWLFLVDPRIISIVGPTASGKTNLSLQLAEYLTQQGCPTEIINQDAYHVYKHLSVGTAKPTADELSRVRHHLIDVLEPSERMTVARFQNLAREAIKDCAHRHIRPLLIGGSGLYSRAAIDALHFRSENMSIRKYLQDRVQKEGIKALFYELKILNPTVSASISIQNERRVIRALEVLYTQRITSADGSLVQTAQNGEIQNAQCEKLKEIMQKEISNIEGANKDIDATGSVCENNTHRNKWDRIPSSNSNLKTYLYALPTVQIGLDFDREILKERIRQRTQQMWDRGWVEEVEWLYSHLSFTANQALGYQEIVNYLQGKLSKNEALEAINQKTYRLAKKQMGWFGRDPRIHWLNGQSGNLLEEAIDIVRQADRGEFDSRDYGEHVATQWHLGDIIQRQSPVS